MVVRKYNDDFFIVNFDTVIASSCEEDILLNIPKEYVEEWEKEIPHYIEIKRDINIACTCKDYSDGPCFYSYWDGVEECCNKRFSDGTYFKETIYSNEKEEVIIIEERFPEKIFNLSENQFPLTDKKIKVYIEDINAWVEADYLNGDLANVYLFPGSPTKMIFSQWKEIKKD